MSIKHFAQVDSNGAVHVAFVGTEADLQAQIDKDYAEAVAKANDAIKKYEEELAKVEKVDFEHLNLDNIEEAAKYVHYTKMLLKTKKELAEFKKPDVKDGTYFVLDFIGKPLEMEEK